MKRYFFITIIAILCGCFTTNAQIIIDRNLHKNASKKPVKQESILTKITDNKVQLDDVQAKFVRENSDVISDALEMNEQGEIVITMSEADFVKIGLPDFFYIFVIRDIHDMNESFKKENTPLQMRQAMLNKMKEGARMHSNGMKSVAEMLEKSKQ